MSMFVFRRIRIRDSVISGASIRSFMGVYSREYFDYFL